MDQLMELDYNFWGIGFSRGILLSHWYFWRCSLSLPTANQGKQLPGSY